MWSATRSSATSGNASRTMLTTAGSKSMSHRSSPAANTVEIGLPSKSWQSDSSLRIFIIAPSAEFGTQSVVTGKSVHFPSSGHHCQSAPQKISGCFLHLVCSDLVDELCPLGDAPAQILNIPGLELGSAPWIVEISQNRTFEVSFCQLDFLVR